MGQTVTQPLTLRHFVDQYLSAATETRILTRCVSSGPLQWLLHGLPPTARLSIMTRSIPPDLKAVMDTALGTDPECWGGCRTSLLQRPVAGGIQSFDFLGPLAPQIRDHARSSISYGEGR